MLPSVANEEALRNLHVANCLRRVRLINAGELTDGSENTTGVSAATMQMEAMKKYGIEVATLAVGPAQDREPRHVATNWRKGLPRLTEGVRRANAAKRADKRTAGCAMTATE